MWVRRKLCTFAKKITKTYAKISDNALSIRTGFKMTNYMVK